MIHIFFLVFPLFSYLTMKTLFYFFRKLVKITALEQLEKDKIQLKKIKGQLTKGKLTRSLLFQYFDYVHVEDDLKFEAKILKEALKITE